MHLNLGIEDVARGDVRCIVSYRFLPDLFQVAAAAGIEPQEHEFQNIRNA